LPSIRPLRGLLRANGLTEVASKATTIPLSNGLTEVACEARSTPPSNGLTEVASEAT
jgi:hypothetical protein